MCNSFPQANTLAFLITIYFHVRFVACFIMSCVIVLVGFYAGIRHLLKCISMYDIVRAFGYMANTRSADVAQNPVHD